MMGKKSELTLGYYDKSRYIGGITWHPVEFKYMYAMKLDGIKVNDKEIDIGCKEK